MTFNQIAIKNFKGNMKRYLTYFLCNSFSIMIFFMYSTLLFNDKLNNSTELEKGVSSAIIIPNVALIVFSIFFISYAHSSFIKARKKEFGLFMNLGMSISDIRKIILVENGVIAIASIVLGVLSGTIFSRLFFLFIMRVIDVVGVPFHVEFINYIFSIGVFSAIFILTILVTIIVTSRYEIINLLKVNRVSGKNKISSPIVGVIGIVMLTGSMIFLYANFNIKPNKDGELLLMCTIYCVIGLYITISQLGSSILNLTKKHSKVYYDKLLLITSLNYKFKQTKKIMFIIAVLVMVTIFYSGFCLNLMLLAERTATEANPYDIAFVQTPNKNNISQEQLNNLINTKENPVTRHENLEYINYFDISKYNEGIIIISEEQLNKVSNRTFNISRGNYFRLIPFDLITKEEKDSYIENNFIEDDITLNLSNEVFIYKVQGNVFGTLFNNLNYLHGRLIIINNEDYRLLKNKNKGIEIGRIHLINFKDWKKTKGIVSELDQAMKTYNETTSKINESEPAEYIFKVAAKIESYNYNKQGGALMFYLVTFIGIFFFIASCVILFLRLYSEIENEKRDYKKLYKLGITEKEIRKNIARELRVLFFVAPIIGMVIAFIYTSVLYKNSELVFSAYLSNLIVSGIYLCFQSFYYLVSKRMYGNEIIESLG